MKIFATNLFLLLVENLAGASPHCRRYLLCINGARNDYEQCVGGVAAAVISDNENAETVNILLERRDRIITCENRFAQEIADYKLARQQEDEDILKCTSVFAQHSSFGQIDNIKKIACAGIPTSWDLRDLIGDIMEKRSECRGLYDLQLQRCSFLLNCCPVYSLCMASVSLNSTVHSKVVTLRKGIADGAKQCLDSHFVTSECEQKQKYVTATWNQQGTSIKNSKCIENEKLFQPLTVATPDKSDSSGLEFAKTTGMNNADSQTVNLNKPRSTDGMEAVPITQVSTMTFLESISTLPETEKTESLSTEIDSTTAGHVAQTLKLATEKTKGSMALSRASKTSVQSSEDPAEIFDPEIFPSSSSTMQEPEMPSTSQATVSTIPNASSESVSAPPNMINSQIASTTSTVESVSSVVDTMQNNQSGSAENLPARDSAKFVSPNIFAILFPKLHNQLNSTTSIFKNDTLYQSAGTSSISALLKHDDGSLSLA